MRSSIWTLSGAHWLRVGFAWACFAAFIACLPQGHADEGDAVASKKPLSPLAAERRAAIETGALAHGEVSQVLRPFDFASVLPAGYGDAE